MAGSAASTRQESRVSYRHQKEWTPSYIAFAYEPQLCGNDRHNARILSSSGDGGINRVLGQVGGPEASERRVRIWGVALATWVDKLCPGCKKVPHFVKGAVAANLSKHASSLLLGDGSI